MGAKVRAREEKNPDHLLRLSLIHICPVFLLNSCLDRFSAPSHKRVGTLYPVVTVPPSDGIDG